MLKKDKNVLIRMDATILTFLRKLAEKNHTSMSHEIRSLLIEKMRSNERLDSKKLIE
jgi:hypothetical protein